MKVDALEVNIHNPKIRDRIAKISKLLPLDDGTKLTAREVQDEETLKSGRLSGYDLHVFEHDEPRITYAVFSFDTPIAWVIEDKSGRPLRFITNLPITTTTERHRDVVRRAWLGKSGS